MKKYILHYDGGSPNRWTLTDTENNIIVSFNEGYYNETKEISVLGNFVHPDALELSEFMIAIENWLKRHHSSIYSNKTYGFEISEDEKKLFLYRGKDPKWIMEIKGPFDNKRLASSLRKAAEFLIKSNTHE